MSIALGVQRSLIISEHRTGAPGWFESIIDNHLDSKGYTMPVNTQDRNKQPARTGGNCSEMQSEAHNAAKGEQIAQGSGKGDMTPGTGFQCGGNASCAGSKEKHDQAKDMGKKFVGGKAAGAAPIIPSEVQVSERRHGAGNNPDGGHEHQTKGKERISAAINRN